MTRSSKVWIAHEAAIDRHRNRIEHGLPSGSIDVRRRKVGLIMAAKMSVWCRPVVLGAILLVMPVPSTAGGIGPETFIAATADIEVRGIGPLARAVDADPFGIAVLLQNETGGRKALHRYAAVMLETGEGQRLGAQWAVIVGDAKAMGRSEQKDGGVWYPVAEDAGFFTGGILAALEQRAEAVPAFSTGAGIVEPTPDQDVLEWLVRQIALPDGPARDALRRAARAGAVR